MRNVRTSVVGNIKVINTIFSSILQIGDNVSVTPVSNSLAVQRQVSSYRGNEGNLDEFPIFKRPIPEGALTERLNMNIHNETSEIHVGNIYIFGLSIASVLQIGSNKMTAPENRTKHIRQLIPGGGGAGSVTPPAPVPPVAPTPVTPPAAASDGVRIEEEKP